MTTIAIPQPLLFGLYWCAALIVLSEALNKLHRIDPLKKGLTRMERARAMLNMLGWMLFSVAAGGALVSPVMGVYTVKLQDAALMLGLAVFIAHRRLKEISPGLFKSGPPDDEDAYEFPREIPR